MGAWGTGAFDNDSAGDLLYDIIEGQFSFEALVVDTEAADLDHGTGVALLVLAELVLVGRGLRDPPVDEGVTVELARRTVSDDQAVWLLEQVPRVLGGSSEESELWSEAGQEKFTAWLGHANAAVADLRRVLGPGEQHPQLF